MRESKYANMLYKYASQRSRYVSCTYKSHNMTHKYAKASESQRCRYVSYIYKSHIMTYRCTKASESQWCRYVSYIYKSHIMTYRCTKASESQWCRYVSYIYKSKKYDTQVCKSFSYCGVTMFHTYIRVTNMIHKYAKFQSLRRHYVSYIHESQDMIYTYAKGS